MNRPIHAPLLALCESLIRRSAPPCQRLPTGNTRTSEGTRDQIAKDAGSEVRTSIGWSLLAIRVFVEQLDPFLTPPDQLGTCLPDHVIRPSAEHHAEKVGYPTFDP
jgi:hypothetical protein